MPAWLVWVLAGIVVTTAVVNAGGK